jgi:16S rRNA (cytidine1402-2'-O)-methyltransferase
MALQLSGFSGQQFAFHGYLPKETEALQKKIVELEKGATHATQIWIEAPYRSQKMLEHLVGTLRPTTRLCVAAQLTFPGQRVVSQTVAKWREDPFKLEKEPTVFLVGSSSSF